MVKVLRIVLTGGPCAGKTSAQARLAEFFENLDWKVYRVPETATTLLCGGVKWPELSHEQAYLFQLNLLKTLLQIEQTFFDLAAGHRDKNVLVICDRGAMDPFAFVNAEDQERMLRETGQTLVGLRDQRYDLVVHMVSASNGAEGHYQLDNNTARKENLDLAREMDRKASLAWVGQPYLHVIDNSTGFEDKLHRVIQCVCERLGVGIKDRLAPDARKRKFLVSAMPEVWPVPYQDFEVEHVYLLSNDSTQARVRRRGQGGCWTYTHTVRLVDGAGGRREKRVQISVEEFEALKAQRDGTRQPVFKTRRCFLWLDTYFQLDMYRPPHHPRCTDLRILELFTIAREATLPDFLTVAREVTEDPAFSMFQLARVADS